MQGHELVKCNETHNIHNHLIIGVIETFNGGQRDMEINHLA
jgi:hypothetical protein